MVTLSRRSARLLIIPLAALLVAACEHNDLGPATTITPPTGPGPSLGTASTYGILAATAVSCVTNGTISADVGISPGGALTGFPPCAQTGAQHLADAAAAAAQVDLTTAYNALVALPCDFNIVADLGGTTITPGVYCSAASVGVTGTVTLDGGGDPDARFVIKAGSTLTTAGAVALTNGTQAKNVWWQVGSSATLGTASAWKGNILAQITITLNDNANMLGRALARTGAVTLGTNNFIALP